MPAADPTTAETLAASTAWRHRAAELAAWAMARLVNRTDRCGGYYADDEGKTRQTTRPASAPEGGFRPGFLDPAMMARHFRAIAPRDVVGVHALGADSFGLWAGIDIDAHGDDADEDANLQFALHAFVEARKLGLCPLLYESNGRGGYHLLVLFADPVAGSVLRALGLYLVRDHAGYGLAAPPEVFPKQDEIGPANWGNWLRVIGRHHTRPFWPRVWDGKAWLSDSEAVDHVLAQKGSDPAEIPPEVLAKPEPPPPPPKPELNGHAKHQFDRPDVFAAYNRTVSLADVVAWHERAGHKVSRRGTDRTELTRSGKDGGQSFNVKVIDGVPVTFNFSTASGLPPQDGLSPSRVRCLYETGACDQAAMAAFADKLRDEMGWPARPKRESPKLYTPPPAADAPPAPTGTDGEVPTGVQVILAHYREVYRPTFKRGNSIYCGDGQVVPMSVAAAVPTSALVGRLAGAADAPRDRAGAVKRDAIPAFFNKWAKVAWGDLLASLPDEDTAELGTVEPAREEFRRLVREAMLTEVVLGDVIGSGDATQTERRPLIDWCYRFAKTERWGDIRGKKCWCKLVVKDGGELLLKVAIRHELFAQIRADKRLSEMGANTFSRRAARYDVGTSSRKDRPHGVAALVLADDLVADLISSFSDDDVPTVGENPTSQTDLAGPEKAKCHPEDRPSN